jgi:glycogen phosphorylase
MAPPARPVASDPVAYGWDKQVEIAYYSMEIALEDAVPTFSGGLGVLAGDHLRAAADRGLPLAAVTLLYSHGFFRQTLVAGAQHEAPVDWDPAAHLEELPVRVSVVVAGRKVVVGAWRKTLVGVDGGRVDVHFLDTNLEENAPDDRVITDRLYTSDPYERLRQEAVLGLAGPLVLDALGHQAIRVHHLNEGHGALVPVGLLARRLAAANPGGPLDPGLVGSAEDLATILRSCVFTTHTPVPAGHDRFSQDVARTVLGQPLVDALGALGCLEQDGTLNMTLLGLRFAGFVNGVSRKHAEVTRGMFPEQSVESITNGVHVATWASPATAELFDRRLPGWRADSQMLRYAEDIPLEELRAAHEANKRALCDAVRGRTGAVLRPEVLTLGIARRFAQYKRNDLVLSDMERLAAIAGIGPVQVVFAGKAHPGDQGAKAMLSRVAEVLAGTRPRAVTLAFVPDYGMELGRLLCAGSDVWLNTPAPPNEASGTSGMKAAVNGVPSLSTLDGWWLEGWIEGVTGWAIGPEPGSDGRAPDPTGDAERLYAALEEVVVPAYYKDRDGLLAIGRHAMAINGSFFSAHRMVDEYSRRAYHLPLVAS